MEDFIYCAETEGDISDAVLGATVVLGLTGPMRGCVGVAVA